MLLKHLYQHSCPVLVGVGEHPLRGFKSQRLQCFRTFVSQLQCSIYIIFACQYAQLLQSYCECCNFLQCFWNIHIGITKKLTQNTFYRCCYSHKFLLALISPLDMIPASSGSPWVRQSSNRWVSLTEGRLGTRARGEEVRAPGVDIITGYILSRGVYV